MGDALLGTSFCNCSVSSALSRRSGGGRESLSRSFSRRPPRGAIVARGPSPSGAARCNAEPERDGEGAARGTRRAAMVQCGAALVAVSELLGRGAGSAGAVGQGMVAGRIPGLSDPDDEGLRTYRRPEAKSGGHGVGWSPIIPYSFKVPTDWQEVPVSIADLGGTEIDLRFQSSSEGNISVVVAPVLRFSSNLGDNVKIEDVGVPQKVIDAFGPELTGATVEGKVKAMDVKRYDGRTYYQYELEIPHMLVSATAAGNRLYLFSASGNGRQWKKFFPNLKDIRDSFRVG